MYTRPKQAVAGGMVQTSKESLLLASLQHKFRRAFRILLKDPMSLNRLSRNIVAKISLTRRQCQWRRRAKCTSMDVSLADPILFNLFFFRSGRWVVKRNFQINIVRREG